MDSETKVFAAELREMAYCEDSGLIASALTRAADTIARQADEIERLKGKLRSIASCQSFAPGDIVDIARSALNQE